MHVRGLNVGLDAENQPRRELPVVANLAAAQDPIQIGCAAKADPPGTPRRHVEITWQVPGLI